MRKNIFQSIYFLIAYCAVVFIISLIVISKIMNRGNVDMTASMSDATLPTFCFMCDDMEFNLLRGYGQEMDSTHMRDNITPVGTDRKLKFKINTHDATVTDISFELRSTDGTRLVEQSTVNDYVRNQDTIVGTINLKDLIYDHVEYSICITVKTSRGQSIHYYTKLIEADDYDLAEKLQYVYDFSDATFDKERAENEITTYIESNSEGDNTSFSKVNIHNSLSQITWGDLGVKRKTYPVAAISQIDKDIAVLKLDYFVSLDDDHDYRVMEMYRIRKGEERMFLLDYERQMQQVFDADTDNIAGNKIELGIIDSSINLSESSDGNRIAFVNNGRLFAFNILENKLAYVYGFFDDVTDERETYDQNDIKVFSIDQDGNIYFMVYGYMNKGNHEGEMGCLIAYYDSKKNYVEELAFVPSESDFYTVSRDVKDLSYIGDDKILYLLQGSHIYSIDLDNDDINDIAAFKDDNAYVVSKDSSKAAWVSEDSNRSTKLTFMDMEIHKDYSITAPEGDYIKPVGFFGEDLIYGLVHKSDVTKDISGRDIFPMYVIYIVDKELNTVKTYDASKEYVIKCIPDGDYLINLKRLKKDSNGVISTPVPDDQLIDNVSAASMKNSVVTVPIERFEKIVQIVFNKEVDNEKTQLLTPKLVLFEGDRSIEIDKETFESSYYVYVKGTFAGVYDNLTEASLYAFNEGGCVYDKQGQLVYQKTTLMNKNQIMAITGNSIREGEDESQSLAVCINTVLEYEGVTKDTRKDCMKGTDTVKILEDNLENVSVLDFRGSDLDIVLSYVEKDIPVIAEMGDGRCYLIIGYNEFNTVVMNPITGAVYKVGMGDSRAMFAGAGNRFITYKKNEY